MLGERGLVLEGLVAVKAGQLVVLHVAPQRLHVEERLRAELAREEVLGGRAAACTFLFYSIIMKNESMVGREKMGAVTKMRTYDRAECFDH